MDVTDTNNNDPLFTPNSVYEFTVIPPLPPGFQVTGCWNDIIARDIDLTTQRVEFEIYDSSYFEISYDADSSTVSKEFKASLKTTTFMRSIPEPIEFRISATVIINQFLIYVNLSEYIYYTQKYILCIVDIYLNNNT